MSHGGPASPARRGQPDLMEHFFITRPDTPVVGTEAPGFLESRSRAVLIHSSSSFSLPESSLFTANSAPVEVGGTTAARAMMEEFVWALRK